MLSSTETLKVKQRRHSTIGYEDPNLITKIGASHFNHLASISSNMHAEMSPTYSNFLTHQTEMNVRSLIENNTSKGLGLNRAYLNNDSSSLKKIFTQPRNIKSGKKSPFDMHDYMSETQKFQQKFNINSSQTIDQKDQTQPYEGTMVGGQSITLNNEPSERIGERTGGSNRTGNTRMSASTPDDIEPQIPN